MINHSSSGTFLEKRSVLFIVFLICEMLVFFIAITFYPSLTRSTANLLQIFLAGIFGGSALILRKNEKYDRYWQIPFALFIASVAMLLRAFLGDMILDLSGVSVTSPKGIAIAKFSGSIWQVLAVLVLIKLGGEDLKSVYLNKGRLGLGLGIGFAAFIFFAVLSYAPVLNIGIEPDIILSWTPWVLLFVFSNGFTEELLFRGLFLRRLEPFLGKNLSSLVLALVFTLTHMNITYDPEIFQFLLVVFPLALVWGYLMQKSDSLWGSAVFHAGADLLIIVGYFAVL